MLDGWENAEIRARVTACQTRRNYQEGSFLKKGDLLFEIDPTVRGRAAEAKSNLEQRRQATLQRKQRPSGAKGFSKNERFLK